MSKVLLIYLCDDFHNNNDIKELLKCDSFMFDDNITKETLIDKIKDYDTILINVSNMSPKLFYTIGVADMLNKNIRIYDTSQFSVIESDLDWYTIYSSLDELLLFKKELEIKD